MGRGGTMTVVAGEWPAVVPAPVDPGVPEFRLDAPTLRHVEPVLRGLALRAVRRADLAEDLVQETYLAAWRSQHTFRGQASLRTWMVGILSRKIVDHYRRSRREVLTDEPPEAPQDDPSPWENRLDAKKARAVIERRLGDLGPLERKAVLLCDVQQADRSTASASLGVTRGHLRVLLHRGRHRLREALEAADLTP